MNRVSQRPSCEIERVALHALGALPAAESQVMQNHLGSCQDCREEFQRLQSVVESFVFWPTDLLRPSASLWNRVAARIAVQTGEPPISTPVEQTRNPEWEDVAPGISCQLLATDSERDRVSMLVRLAPGAAYPPHTHRGIEELHLLAGELWIEDRKLLPGDYNRAEPGTGDQRVWSETGCTCVLITSTADLLR